MANVASRAQPPDEAPDEPTSEQEEEAEVVDLTQQRLLGWLRGMFGGPKKQPPRDDA
jgi:hypothetical protein